MYSTITVIVDRNKTKGNLNQNQIKLATKSQVKQKKKTNWNQMNQGSSEMKWVPLSAYFGTLMSQL